MGIEQPQQTADREINYPETIQGFDRINDQGTSKGDGLLTFGFFDGHVLGVATSKVQTCCTGDQCASEQQKHGYVPELVGDWMVQSDVFLAHP